jgi:protein-disulfide isomerase
MTDSGRPGGDIPPAPRPKRAGAASGRRAPMTRQERREAQRRAGASPTLVAARTTPVRAAWQSPMVLTTIAALIVGVIIIVIASGVLSAKPATASGLRQPLQPVPGSLVDSTDTRSLGQKSAPVQVDVWSDFQCPYCGVFALDTEPAFITQYVATGKVHLTYRDAIVNDPLISDANGVAGQDPHGESHEAAAAARCAADQGKFWPFHDYLFENQSGENEGTFSAAFLARIADAIGLDRTKFDACMAGGSSAKLADVEAESAQAQAAGVKSTPTITVNGMALSLPGRTEPGGAIDLAELGQAVDAAIAGRPSPAPAASAAPSASGAASSVTPAPSATP